MTTLLIVSQIVVGSLAIERIARLSYKMMKKENSEDEE